MDIEEFDDCVDRLGEDPTLWPSPAREQGLALLRDEPAARAIVSQAKLLRTALSAAAPARAPAGLADRIVQKAVAARAPVAPTVPTRVPWLSQAVGGLFISLRPAVILPLCFFLGIALGWLPTAFQANALRLDVPVLLTGMVE